jgi:hypothetical protein
MKVKELIEKLQKFDPELLVVVDGYEGGVDSPQEPREVMLRLNVHDTEKYWYYGKHDFHHVTDSQGADCAAVHIPR